ncbi:MAG: hypothetical protein H0W97_02930 [Actinobacteria bacterium]|nr:hypothetical protein [Actinomycetota bacterium]
MTDAQIQGRRLDSAKDRLLAVLYQCAHYVDHHAASDPEAAELAREHRAARDEMITATIAAAELLREAGVDVG